MSPAMAAVGNPVRDDPLLSLGFTLFFLVAATFIVGALLFQFRFRAIWCLVVCEAMFLLFYFGIVYGVDPHMWQFSALQFLLLPVLCLPTYLGYYFNKHIISS